MLLDRRLLASMEPHTVTGWGLCPEHARFSREGFVALVECDPAKSGRPNADGTLKPWRVFRTGIVTYLKREVFLDLFTVPTRELMAPCVFVDPTVTKFLKSHVAARPD
jgi:hypothetical protein